MFHLILYIQNPGACLKQCIKLTNELIYKCLCEPDKVIGPSQQSREILVFVRNCTHFQLCAFYLYRCSRKALSLGGGDGGRAELPSMFCGLILIL